MTTLVTGGAGLVGSRLLRHLVQIGADCRALVRSGKKTPAGITRVDGDIFDPVALRQGRRGRIGRHSSCRCLSDTGREGNLARES
jgi:uncharacterized protein YbjT (DUF2867 family)